MSDLTAIVSQTVTDKLLDSVSYPFEIFLHDEPFPGFGASLATRSLSGRDATRLLGEAVKSQDSKNTAPPKDDKERFYSELIAGAAVTIESAKHYLAAHAAGGSDFDGPDPAYAQAILDAGVEGLAGIAGIEFKFYCPYAQVLAGSRPSLSLNVPRTDVSGLNVVGSAVGELWWYHPVFHCSRLCTKWSVTWEWSCIARMAVNGVRFDAAGHAILSSDAAVVQVVAVFDRLRLNYPILDQIPLEGLANRLLASKTVVVIDASQFIATIPVLKSRFRVASISLPPGAGRIAAEIDVVNI